MSMSELLPRYSFIWNDINEKDINETEESIMLFEFFKNNDFNGFTKYLEEHPSTAGRLHEVRNKYGHNLLVSAIKNKQVKLTTLLIQFDNDLFSLENALLMAVENSHFEVMILILRKLRKLKKENMVDETATIPCKGNKGLWKNTCEQFAPYVTPMLIACEANNFISIKILLKYGHRLHFPHHRDCQCTVCRKNRSHSLTEAIARYRQHKAIICPAYLCLTNVDPILEAFRMKQDYWEESIYEPEFSEEYVSLNEQCASFVTAMLQLCKTKEEVMVLLSRKSEFNKLQARPFNRVAQALELNCPNFVGHANCQQVLSAEWYKNNEWMKHASKTYTFCVFIVRTIFLPFFMAILLVAPFSPLAERHKSPSNRCMNDASSHTIFFLITLAVSYSTAHQKNRGPPETYLLYVLLIYVTGIWIDKLTLVYKRGRQAFLLNSWNVFDILMVTFYTLTFIAWALSAREVRLDPDSIEIPREYWAFYDPKLVAETLYTMAVLLTVIRSFSFMQMSRAIGPLQLSIFKLALYMVPLFIILSIVWVSFSVALYILYNYYTNLNEKISENESKQSDAFTTLIYSLHSLYWFFLGMYELDTADVVLPQIYMKVGGNQTALRHRHGITQSTGLLLLGLFQLLGALVLFEMMIAIMVDAYTDIAEKDLIEFKVFRIKIWMGYFYSDHPLPPPFNLIPRPISVYKTIHRIVTSKPSSLFKRKAERNHPSADDEIYQRLMVNLIRRYFKENYKEQLADKEEANAWADL